MWSKQCSDSPSHFHSGRVRAALHWTTQASSYPHRYSCWSPTKSPGKHLQLTRDQSLEKCWHNVAVWISTIIKYPHDMASLYFIWSDFLWENISRSIWRIVHQTSSRPAQNRVIFMVAAGLAAWLLALVLRPESWWCWYERDPAASLPRLFQVLHPEWLYERLNDGRLRQMQHLSESCCGWEVWVGVAVLNPDAFCFLLLFSLLFSLLFIPFPSLTSLASFLPPPRTRLSRLCFFFAIAFIWPLKSLYKGQVRAKEPQTAK